ncbi:Trichothecene 3-o-acetyltransferase [Lasiodiplodia theobromae]|uniref:Trichothecene 3-o-acetyltransferase n=1 Tax=Lasiodiplodia theobromae TaxID=45133 RepID=UPI0015C3A19F|nr:Trichothecene 3-o-acetyltransferase [Lasiodiplodia theobromae]KAF4539268.1 Trichothecene 3-o-acetyltransferase [Lasiodiplodia theobromae]
MTTVIDVLKSMRKHAEEDNRNTTSSAAESSSPPRNDNDLGAVTLETALTPLCHDAYLQRRILPLGPLDQVQVRKNTPRIFCFPMPDQRQSTVSAATIALRLAVQKTLARWPWLGGTVVPVGYDGWGPAMKEEDKKRLEIRYTVPPLDAVMVEGGGCGVFSAKVWSDFTPYARLAARGMPPKVLDCRQLMMRDEGVVVDTGLPALRVQANFIPGGLLLAVMDAHPAVDGVGGQLVVEELARCLRPGAETMAAEEGRRVGAAAGARDDNNYMVSNNARGSQGANAAAGLQSTPTVPEFELPDPEPPVTSSKDASISAGNPSARILTIRAATITSLKAAVMAELQATAAPGAFVSTHDVLSALIWTATMRARAPRLLHQQDNTQNEDSNPHDLLTRFCTPVDARAKPKASPLIAPTYPGNAVVFAFATMPMAELLLLGDDAADANAATETTTITLTRTTTTTTTTIGEHIDSTTSRTRVAKASTTTSVTALARAALAIRRAISAVDGDFVQHRVEAWSGLDDPRQLLATLGAKMDLRETGVFVTSWVGFGADVEWSIPGVAGAEQQQGVKAACVRKPWCEGEGGVNVMPRRGGTRGGEEDWEVLVRLGERDMERFLEMLGGVVVRVVE